MATQNQNYWPSDLDDMPEVDYYEQLAHDQRDDDIATDKELEAIQRDLAGEQPMQPGRSQDEFGETLSDTELEKLEFDGGEELVDKDEAEAAAADEELA